MSVRQACRAVRLSRSMLYYQPKPRNDGQVIEAVMDYITKNPRHGFGLLYSSFVNMQHPWGKTVLWRIYCELNLNLPRRGKKRLPERIREPLDVPSMPNKTWSVDFMTDALWSGRRFCIFNVLDDFNRGALRIEIDTSLPAARIVRALDELIEMRGKPKRLRIETARNSSAGCWLSGQSAGTSYCNSFNPANQRRMLISNGLTALIARKYWIAMSSTRWIRSGA